MTKKFIVLEGPDGTGKTTIIERLKEELCPAKFTFVKDPGGTKIGDQIRKILLDKNNRSISDLTELLLFMASRAQLVKEMIEPNLKQRHVISDRFTLSTLTYQAEMAKYGDLAQIVNFGLNRQPDLILLLDAPPHLTRKRIKARDLDRIETKSVSYFEKVRARYFVHCKRYNVKLFDAALPIDNVYSQVFESVAQITKI
ncbi:MAG: hypothetical protein RLZ12_114 [Bacillota bacterium]